MNVCYYSITKNKDVPDHWDARFTITPDQAINQFDEGILEFPCISKERCYIEYRGFEILGYTMKSEAEEYLSKVFG